MKPLLLQFFIPLTHQTQRNAIRPPNNPTSTTLLNLTARQHNLNQFVEHPRFPKGKSSQGYRLTTVHRSPPNSKAFNMFSVGFTFAENQCIGTLYEKLYRHSAGEQTATLEDATKTAKDDPLDSNDLENESVHSADRLSRGMLHLDDNPTIGTLPTVTSTSSSKAKIDQRSAAIKAAVDAALQKKSGGLEAYLDAHLQAYIDARLSNMSAECAKPAVFEEKLSELKAVVRKELTKLSEDQYEELGFIANNVYALAKAIQAVSDCAAECSKWDGQCEDKQYGLCGPLVAKLESAIQDALAILQRISTTHGEVQDDSKEHLRSFCVASQRVRDASAVVSGKIQGLVANGPALDQQKLIGRGKRNIATGVQLVEDAYLLRLQVSTVSLEGVAVNLEEVAFYLGQ
jgi:hypothetical protein